MPQLPSHLFPPLLVLAAGLVAAVARADDDGPDPLFGDTGILDVQITAPMSEIMDERPVRDYIKGKFAVTEADGRLRIFDVGLRTRGNFRRREEICEFAPLRVNFKKSQTRNTLFDNQDKLKLVTHCENGSRNYEQSVIAEYVAYRVFNLLTDISFRARLLRVRYVDTARDNREYESYAVIIEHKDRLAERTGLSTVDIRMITVPQLVYDHAALGAVFQYFLGNTDFSQIATAPGEDCCHNHELFQTDEDKYYSVPYDFDMTGFVEAPHARPNSRFGLRNVRERLYRGRCLYNDHVAAAAGRFRENEKAIRELIESQQPLRGGKKRDQLRFVDSFFKDIESPRDIEKNLTEDCVSVAR